MAQRTISGVMCAPRPRRHPLSHRSHRPASFQLRAHTWASESHGLFDYESRNHHSKTFKCSAAKSAYRVLRSGTNVQLWNEEDALNALKEDESLRTLARLYWDNVSGAYFLVGGKKSEGSEGMERLWLVIRDRGVRLQENDTVKLGRFRLKVKEIIVDDEQVQHQRRVVCDDDECETVAPPDLQDDDPLVSHSSIPPIAPPSPPLPSSVSPICTPSHRYQNVNDNTRRRIASAPAGRSQSSSPRSSPRNGNNETANQPPGDCSSSGEIPLDSSDIHIQLDHQHAVPFIEEGDLFVRLSPCPASPPVIRSSSSSSSNRSSLRALPPVTSPATPQEPGSPRAEETVGPSPLPLRNRAPTSDALPNGDFTDEEEDHQRPLEDKMPSGDRVQILSTLSMQAPVCRICLCEEEDPASNPLVAPCKCKGSMRWVHLHCLRTWMEGRLGVRHDGTMVSFYWRTLECELCRLPYPTFVAVGEMEGSTSGESQRTCIELFEIPRPSPPYIILEPRLSQGRGLHIVSLAHAKYARLGRGHESDIRLSDISVSRHHAWLKFQPAASTKGNTRSGRSSVGFFLLEDHRSKFGTLMEIRKPYKLDPGTSVSLQVGRTLLNFTIRKKWRILPITSCLKSSVTGDTDITVTVHPNPLVISAVSSDVQQRASDADGSMLADQQWSPYRSSQPHPEASSFSHMTVNSSRFGIPQFSVLSSHANRHGFRARLPGRRGSGSGISVVSDRNSQLSLSNAQQPNVNTDEHSSVALDRQRPRSQSEIVERNPP